jgi:hypothetical protein
MLLDMMKTALLAKVFLNKKPTYGGLFVDIIF